MAYKINLFDTDFDCIGTGCMSLDFLSYQLQCAQGQDLEVIISSGGGSAFDAVAMYNCIKSFPGTVTTDNISLAGSAAATIFAAGKVRRMSKYALLMIHPAQVGSFGDAIELAADAVMIQKITDNVISIWVDVTGQSVEKITELVNATTWLNADEALALGFATEIYDTADNSLEELGILNGAVILNQVKQAPTKYQQVINKILIKQPAIEPQNNNNMATVTKEEVEAMVKPTNTILGKILNFFKASNMITLTTNKGEKYVAGNLVVGASVYNDTVLDKVAEDDEDMEATDSVGNKVKMSVKDGVITNVKNVKEDDQDDESDDDDFDADNKAIVTNSAISIKKVAGKVDHKAIKNAMAKKLGEQVSIVNQQNALLVDLRSQLTASNTLVQRSETEVRNQIITDYVPNNSNRQSRPGGVNAEPASFAKLKEGSFADNAAKMALNKQKK